MGRTKPAAPADLGARGRKFWRDTLAAFELERDECELLAEVCRMLDECETLHQVVTAEGATVAGSKGQTRVHPAVGELRQSRAALGKLLAQLGLPDAQGNSVDSPATARARRAARVRWALERERDGAA